MLLNPLRAGALAALSLLPGPALASPAAAAGIGGRQLPAEPEGVKTITGPGGLRIRYKQPGKEGLCETTPGVNSYSGYVDLDDKTHMFFYFFEARHDPDSAPLTLWLNGGPGSDSMIGLFEELGPCYVTEDLKSHVNPYSFTEHSNMLFLSQPVGVGFSYEEEVEGTINNVTGYPEASTPADGRYSSADPSRTDTTARAAEGAWEVLQALIGELPSLDARVRSRDFSLWTESYGGHWGPTFFRHFSERNAAIRDGTGPSGAATAGTLLNMHSLGIINGIISAAIQTPYYPEFAYNNTYGIQAVNETVYEYMKSNFYFPGACRDNIELCAASDHSTPEGKSTCAIAAGICRGLVEGPYYAASGRSPYDVRARADFAPPSHWARWLNTPDVQDALGVEVNYTTPSSAQVFAGFGVTGDFVYAEMLRDLEWVVSSGVAVHLVYGDADYICNWYGGEAVSLALEHERSQAFRDSGYQPFVVGGREYGEGRQHGNLSFTRVYDAGHEVPYYQPAASLELFRRAVKGLAIADGKEKVTPDYDSEGGEQATHTNSAPTPFYTGRPADPTATSSS